jgi:hypothetical protein
MSNGRPACRGKRPQKRVNAEGAAVPQRKYVSLMYIVGFRSPLPRGVGAC